MRVADIELVGLLPRARPDVAVLGMVVADVELLALPGLDGVLVHDRLFGGVSESGMRCCPPEARYLTPRRLPPAVRAWFSSQSKGDPLAIRTARRKL